MWVNPATTSETVRWNTFVVRIVGYDSVGKALVEMSTTTVDPAIDNPDTACASNRVGENVTCVRMTPRPDGSTVVILEIDYRPEHTIRYLTRFAVHYRTDGTMVSVWTDRLRSTDGVPDRPTFALTDDQLIALATDPQVHP
ncbi:hypothetical protein EV193_103717 [Herbihabitans rhizosphaerae]|uniref:Uncharacterized protein n=1 Tax=Herbihabitans rhizosphaerae TaxID=1872711 RepID=A0A4Q7KXE2_9PSEU|nr:hypothetical protein EV193_103717 [Herbihabitans rhizosphaerae]